MGKDLLQQDLPKKLEEVKLTREVKMKYIKRRASELLDDTRAKEVVTSA